MGRADGVFQFGAFSLDAGERMLLRDGRLVPLPAKVLSTLILLVQNNGHVVEKDVLMKEVWPDEFVEDGNLAQHIFMLRRALGESTEGPNYIETVPRRGYRFFAEMIETAEKDDDQGIDSLAVLPFANASSDPSMEYLSDGITESIMNSLSRLPQLKVMARSTVFSYKGAGIDARKAGRHLGVRTVVMGIVQQLGEQLIISAELVNVEDGSRRYDLAIEQLERTLELEPNFVRAHLHLGMCYERKSMYREAVAELEKARFISENSWTLAGLGHCYASFGARAEAETILDQLLELSRRQFVSCATFAVVYAGFRDRVDQTMEWLEKAHEERSGLLTWLKVWPIFDHLRSDGRFVRLLRRIGFATDGDRR